MKEIKCDGWGRRNCPNHPTVIIITPGCFYCGGGDCGDSGEAEYSCLECAEPFKKYALESRYQEYVIRDLEDNVIWTNQS